MLKNPSLNSVAGIEDPYKICCMNFGWEVGHGICHFVEILNTFLVFSIPSKVVFYCVFKCIFIFKIHSKASKIPFVTCLIFCKSLHLLNKKKTRLFVCCSQVQEDAESCVRKSFWCKTKVKIKRQNHKKNFKLFHHGVHGKRNKVWAIMKYFAKKILSAFEGVTVSAKWK